MGKQVYLGKHKAHIELKEVSGELVEFNGEGFYKISNVDHMRPFFMSLVSDSNHWMFISSNGGLSAGRKDADHALFPYYTDDKITESAEITGSKTLVRITGNDTCILWEPFSNAGRGIYELTRNLYKNTYGNKIIFEEINHDLDISFTYEWNSSDTYGFVRKCHLMNLGGDKLRVEILDGIQNVLPSGLSADFQNIRSNLADAYKRCELESNVGLGIYALSSIIVDKAEPSEALKSNLVWSLGLKDPVYLLSSLQLDAFRRNEPIEQEVDIKAEKGAYFVYSGLELPPGETSNWMIIANVNQTISQLLSLSEKIKRDKELATEVLNDVEAGTDQLKRLTASSDGLQLSEDRLLNTRHFANTLFNIMRGGVFDDNYIIEREDFERYLEAANKEVYLDRQPVVDGLPEKFSLFDLRELVKAELNLDFKRLCLEYMPLKFSRRHGDPSRPWNKFSINTKDEKDGSKILDYEGNWRDIFQNWEALAHSYPEFMESMIHKFLNATTFDGYNPYRVTKGGFDWETIEPDDPWSFIGYWGDHQVIYLLKFLEFIEDHNPGTLSKYTDQRIFVYANVPYKIKGYVDILKNPKDTIDFDAGLDEQIRRKKKQSGADGALMEEVTGGIYKVNLVEKLLAMVLAKMSNFIPGGGIWMNTQRPEWNDANNALVGNGVSMVTLYYLKRFMTFFEKFFKTADPGEIELSSDLATFFEEVIAALEACEFMLDKKMTDSDRKKVLDGLATPASRYRERVYRRGFTGEMKTVGNSLFQQFFALTHRYLDHTIGSNRRDDGMFHSYNLMALSDKDQIEVSRLSVMLEGQVAVLSSGYLNSEQALDLLKALRKSSLYREDQNSYLLYPDKELPRFTEKNKMTRAEVDKCSLLKEMIHRGDTSIVESDVNGHYHFNGNFNNANDLSEALKKLRGKDHGAIEIENKQEDEVLELFEKIFDHKSFTGRSGTFFGYEGLGSIYWHMVSKLLLATQENCIRSMVDRGNISLTRDLCSHFYEIKEGIGVHKPPKLYGAFPTDPYSHTPATKGAQQPGMTGQVKEDVLSRLNELGVQVANGSVSFQPFMLRKSEFLSHSRKFEYDQLNGNIREIELDRGSLVFTYCQTPVLYHLSDKACTEVHYRDGSVRSIDGLELDQGISRDLFQRKGVIDRLELFIPETELLFD